MRDIQHIGMRFYVMVETTAEFDAVRLQIVYI
jgi:hypothetical protein